MDISENFMIMVNMAVAFTFFAWVFKVILEWRRLRHKSELHHKLVEKFGSAKELTEFLETDGGNRFLRSLTINGLAPKEKLLASVSRGVVLTFLGIGLFVLGQIFVGEMRFFNAFGIIAIALGIGFLVSTFISFTLSKKWGIINGEMNSRSVS